MGERVKGQSSTIKIAVVAALLLLVAVATLPFIGQAQETINDTKNQLPDGALDSGPGQEGDGQEGDLTEENNPIEIQFEDPPSYVSNGGSETFRAAATLTASTDLRKGGILSPFRDPNADTEDSLQDCSGSRCVKEKQIYFPPTSALSDKTVEARFETPEKSNTKTTTVTVLDTTLDIEEDQIEAGKPVEVRAEAAAPESVTIESVAFATSKDEGDSQLRYGDPLECGGRTCNVESSPTIPDLEEDESSYTARVSASFNLGEGGTVTEVEKRTVGN